MRLYSVINIDIVGSRKIINRQDIQNIVDVYIDRVNEIFNQYLVCPITVTLGDEWQVMLNDPTVAYEIIEAFQQLLRVDNIEIYAGIGIGTITTGIYDDTRKMDGPCFINARKALKIAKSKNRFYNEELNSKDNRVYFNGDDIELMKLYDINCMNEVAVSTLTEPLKRKNLNNILNNIIENNEVLKSRITEKQWEVIELYDEMGSYNNIIRKKQGLTKASISQKLNDSNYFVIESNRDTIKFLLNLYCKMRGQIDGV